jgi:hypothetical protein
MNKMLAICLVDSVFQLSKDIVQGKLFFIWWGVIISRIISDIGICNKYFFDSRLVVDAFISIFSFEFTTILCAFTSISDCQ